MKMLHRLQHIRDKADTLGYIEILGDLNDMIIALSPKQTDTTPASVFLQGKIDTLKSNREKLRGKGKDLSAVDAEISLTQSYLNAETAQFTKAG